MELEKILDRANSPEYLEAIARIDFCYFQIKEIEKKLSSRTGIDKLIDENTGYEKEIYKSLIENVRSVVNDKEFLKIDNTTEKEALNNFERVFDKIYNN